MISSDKPVIIGETAFHHQGDKEFLIQLIDAAVASGSVNILKFHLLLDLDDYMISSHAAIDALRKLCLSEDDWRTIVQHVKKSPVDVLFLCNDVKSVQFVKEIDYDGIIGIEIHATGINDVFLLEAAATLGKTIVLGTGGSTLDEIGFAVSFLRQRGHRDIFLMHGFQNYPTNYEDVVLSKMSKLASLFELPVGYADHTDPNDENNEVVSCLGVAMGFNVIEKHFTIRPGEKRIDGQSAISMDSLKRVKQLADVFFKVRGIDALAMSAAERKYGDTGPMKKAIVARDVIKEGEQIEVKDLAFKRTNESSSLKQNMLHLLLGQKAKTSIQKDAIVDFTNVNFAFAPSDFSQFKANEK